MYGYLLTPSYSSFCQTDTHLEDFLFQDGHAMAELNHLRDDELTGLSLPGTRLTAACAHVDTCSLYQSYQIA